MKNAILEEIQELLEELEDLYLNVGEQAVEHIHVKYTHGLVLHPLS